MKSERIVPNYPSPLLYWLEEGKRFESEEHIRLPKHKIVCRFKTRMLGLGLDTTTCQKPYFCQLFMWLLGKGVSRNFSRGGLSGAPGEGSPAIFKFPGGGSTPIFGRFNGQNERSFGPGGRMAPLPMPAYALASRAAVEAPNKPPLTVCRD